MKYLFAVLILTAALASGQSLDDTNIWMQGDLDYYAVNGQHLVLKGETLPKAKGVLFTGESTDECRVFVTGETIVDLHAGGKEYPMEYLFHLGTLDPDSIHVQTYKKYTAIQVETTNNESSIWSSWNGKLYTSTLFVFKFGAYDTASEHATRFAKALKHAVILCGGKPSTF